MKKFLRNLFSGYFLVLLILLIELIIFVFFQFFLDEVVSAIVNDDSNSENVRVIISLVYLAARVIIFFISVAIFFI